MDAEALNPLLHSAIVAMVSGFAPSLPPRPISPSVISSPHDAHAFTGIHRVSGIVTVYRARR